MKMVIYDITTHSGTLLRMRYTFVYLRDSKGRWRIVHHYSSEINSCDLPISIITTRSDDDDNDGSPSQLRPSQVDHLVGLLTGTKSVTQSDLIPDRESPIEMYQMQL